MVYPRTLAIAPCAYSKTLSSIPIRCVIACIPSNPQLPVHPSHTPPPFPTPQSCWQWWFGLLANIPTREAAWWILLRAPWFKWEVRVHALETGIMLHLESRSVLPGDSDGKESACNAGGPGSIPGLGRSPGEENGYPFQYSCLENSMDRGAWWVRLSD